MAKAKTVFFCKECGNESPKWLGKCPGCGEWNSFVEEKIRTDRRAPSGQSPIGERAATRPQPITDIPEEEGRRFTTGIEEFDRILGGGIVEGAVSLLGGEPGVGKSTLLLQIAYNLAAKSEGKEKILYVTGEESARQTRMRAERLQAFHPSLMVQCETDVEAIAASIDDLKPRLTVIDSIQTLYSADISSAPGSVAQIRESAARLVRQAKILNCAVIFIGHVTKDGVVAGPRLLEHMVDSVLYFEGERQFAFRILRSIKNRFGSTNEIGIFEMTTKGLVGVPNPSELFLGERPENTPGSVVLAAVEGTRPLLVEVQALVSPSAGFGSPRRAAHGMDAKRLALILAVLEKRLGLALGDRDVFINIAGGLKIEEPALDLAVAAALASSALDRPIDQEAVVFGEVGLAGETRSVTQVEKRLNEARRLGFNYCVYGAPHREKPRKQKGLSLPPASSLEEALQLLGLGRQNR